MKYFFRRILPFALAYIIIQNLLRLSLLIFERHNITLNPWILLKTFLAGFLFDAASGVYFLLPFSIFILAIPKNYSNSIVNKVLTIILFAILIFLLLFEAIALWAFWLEFHAMFNFVAVDYLIYTHEVIENIRESYPINYLLSSIVLIALIISFLFRKKLIPVTTPSNFFKRSIGFLSLIALCVVSFFVIKFEWSEVSSNVYNNELAQSPLFSLFHANNVNELNYNQFYLTNNQKNNLSLIRSKLTDNYTKFIDTKSINRIITSEKTEKKPNIIFVLMESEGANWLNQNRKPGEPLLSPNLSRLAKKSLYFANTNAIGTRTVFGIQATTLSLPPLPGEAVIRRPDSEHLNGIGHIFKQKGYNIQFLYGGYSTFDNMKHYFANNDFKVIDRFNFSKDEITLATAWGVNDLDLYNKAIKEANRAYIDKKPFFQFLLTTSNHRPYKYPNGAIDIPSGSGRNGAVKYADYAVGQFLKAASKQPWYSNTIFVFIGDHQASSAGKMEININKYPVVFMIYSPNQKLIQPRTITTPISQIDVAPTLLGLLNFSYPSSFLGQNALLPTYKPRYFISNYQKVAYIEGKYMVILKPKKQLTVYDITTSQIVTDPNWYKKDLTTAIAYFQIANTWREFLKVR